MVVEDDGPAILNSYRLIFLADSHVTDTASSALVAWVSAGGTLVATAGAGCFNEFNATNTKLTALLGIVTCDGMYEPSSSKVQYEKQELIHFQEHSHNTKIEISYGIHRFNPPKGSDLCQEECFSGGSILTHQHNYLMYMLDCVTKQDQQRVQVSSSY